MSKLKILFNTEFHAASTGYGVYTREVLNRLQRNYGELLEIAELASYASENDPRINQAVWKVYPVIPRQDDKNAVEVYQKDPQNQFGKLAFESVCLDFEPTHIFDIRDNWYCNYELTSPFRPLYNLIWMPTIDSYPLNEEWVSNYTQLDACLAYTDWAIKVLEKQGGGLINLQGIAPPGVDCETFYPFPNKKQLKQQIGLHPDTLIVGMIARNQMRKSFPDLFEVFAKFLVDGPKHITERTLLYLHTCWPDLGWDIPLLLKEFGLSNRVMFTYCCYGNSQNPGCQTVFPSFFHDCRCICKKCGQNKATLVNSHHGVSNTNLNFIYNLFDVFVQYAIAEGLGMPQVEAAGAGVPILTTHYSGMVDIVDKLNAIPIRVLNYNREVTTGRYFAKPDQNDFLRKLTELLELPDSARRSYGYKSRELAKIHYNWDNTAKKWVEVFINLPKKQGWKSTPKIYRPNLQIPNNLNNEQFVQWSLINILGRPDLVNSYLAHRMLRDLNWGHSPTGSMLGLYFSEENTLVQKPQYGEFNRDTAVRELIKMVEFNNHWEQKRKEKMGL